MWKASVAEHPVRLVISVFLFTALTYPYELTRSNLCHQLKRKSRVWFPAKYDHLPRRVDRMRSRCDRYLREGRVVQKTLGHGCSTVLISYSPRPWRGCFPVLQSWSSQG